MQLPGLKSGGTAPSTIAKHKLFEDRMAYIKRHGSAFLFRGDPPPAPGYPRAKNAHLLAQTK